MKRIHIIGGKNHGKTTLIAELVQELSTQGIRVGTIKHTHHAHELDTPGKDSFLHREAGAEVVGIAARNQSAVFWSSPDREQRSSDLYDQFESMMINCDLVIVEGDLASDAPKIEVWRAQVGTPPLAVTDNSIAALVSDDEPPAHCQVFPRRELTHLITAIQELAALVEKPNWSRI